MHSKLQFPSVAPLAYVTVVTIALILLLPEYLQMDAVCYGITSGSVLI
jgi:hypothetical protein